MTQTLLHSQRDGTPDSWIAKLQIRRTMHMSTRLQTTVVGELEG
jgi:hypothetical protein